MLFRQRQCRVIPLSQRVGLLPIAYVHDQRVEIGATFRGIDPRHCLSIIGPRCQPINRLCRHSDQPSSAKNLRSVSDAFCIGLEPFRSGFVVHTECAIYWRSLLQGGRPKLKARRELKQ